MDKQPEPDIRGRKIGDPTEDPKSEHRKDVPGEAQVWGIGKAKL